MISVKYSSFDASDITTVLDYLLEFMMVYCSCFAGTLIRDLITASKKNNHVDIVNAIIYSLPCAFIMTAFFETLYSKAGFGSLVLVCVFVGMWSREIASILLNNKLILSLIKIITGGIIKSNGSLSDDEKEKLTNAFTEAIENSINSTSEENQDDNSAISKEDDGNCMRDDEVPSESTTTEASENEEEEVFVNEEDEISDPVGEFEWTNIIGY
jgi:hypothetical protein